MTQQNSKFNVFVVAAILTAPLSLIVEVGTIAAGHELTWFRALSPTGAQWIRYALLAIALASMVCALAFRKNPAQV